MASSTDICNRALQKLGAARINSLTDQSTNARACALAYDTCRQDLLREHPWNFAIQRFQLSANATAPAFGYTNSFPLPTGWMRVLPPDPVQNFNDRDWVIEAGQLLTNDSTPLNVRCVMDIQDTTLMDVAFREALAAKLSFELAEAITQSNTKKQTAAADYKESINDAKKVNAIEKVPQQAPYDTWITARA